MAAEVTSFAPLVRRVQHFIVGRKTVQYLFAVSSIGVVDAAQSICRMILSPQPTHHRGHHRCPTPHSAPSSHQTHSVTVAKLLTMRRHDTLI